MLTEKQLKKIKEELDDCTNPLYFFHDDPDGLCSFLLFYRYIKEGHGIVVKSHPNIDEKFVRKVHEYDPDKIFVLDIAKMEEEFVSKAKRKIIWIDHHDVKKLYNVEYFNPRKEGNDNIPVSKICYDVVKKDDWIAMIGCVGDWYLPKDWKKFSKKYPELLPETVKGPGEAMFETKLGILVKIFSFILKGTTSKAMKHVKILTRIKDPYEILEQKTSQGRYIYKVYERMNEKYNDLMKDVMRNKGKGRLMVYTYQEDTMSFTGDISNELLHKFPEKIIIIAREKSGEMKTSLRAKKGVKLNQMIGRALVGIEGYGGGHENACGACIKVEDWKRFLENLKRELRF